MTRKPVVTAVDNPFGTFSEEMMNGDGSAEASPFEIKGYSDVRRARERDIAEGRKPRTINNGRFYLARAVNSKDAPDNRKVAQRKAQGYTVVQWEEAKKLGIDLSDSAFQKGADGTVRMSEYVLMHCSAEKAAVNLHRVRKADESLLANSLARAESVAGQVVQMAPQIEEPAAKKP